MSTPEVKQMITNVSLYVFFIFRLIVSTSSTYLHFRVFIFKPYKIYLFYNIMTLLIPHVVMLI